MKLFDNYEISPCRRYVEPDSPGWQFFEVCEPQEADVWTLYGHIDGEGVEAIGDFATREHAEETFSRITGIPFSGAREIAERLRMMHAGPKLLQALSAASEWIAAQLFLRRTGIQETIRKAIAEATGDSPREAAPPIMIEVRGGIVQDVLNLPPGYQYEVKDFDVLDDEENVGARRSE